MGEIGSFDAMFLRLQFYLLGHNYAYGFHVIKSQGLITKTDGSTYECGQGFIEKKMMERAKLASYFISCIYILSLSNLNDFASISSDLSESIQFLTALLNAYYTKRPSRFEYSSDLRGPTIIVIEFSVKSLSLESQSFKPQGMRYKE